MSTATQSCADGIEYLHWVPGKRHFRCEKLSATMSTDDCSGRYMRAMAGDERASACRFCPIGAVHAGKVDPLQAASVSAKVKITGHPDLDTRCTRCGRSGLRLIHAGGDICVSCWNRQREWKLGRNARGRVPKTYVPLRARRVGVIVNGEPGYRLVAETQNDAEALARCIREMPDGLAFHDEPPGITSWNKQAQRFEYRDRNAPGNVMLELEHGGLIHYVSVNETSLRLGEVVAVPCIPTVRMNAHTAATWLALDQDRNGAAITSEWRPQAIVCSACGIAQVQARTIADRVDCRCPACEAKSLSA